MERLEEKILTLLEKDCTLKVAQLAAYCDASEEEVAAAVKALEDDRVILGYKALIDWEKTREEFVTALIEVHVTPQRDKGYDRIAERIWQYDEVESLYLMSGAYDFTVIISGRTLKEVALFVSQKLSPIEGVLSTATHFILHKYKEKHAIFAEPEEQKERMIFV